MRFKPNAVLTVESLSLMKVYPAPVKKVDKAWNSRIDGGIKEKFY